MRKILLILLLIRCVTSGFGQRTITISNPVFTVLYSQEYEQPLKLMYISSNRPKNVDRGSMDFYLEDSIRTSDDRDYRHNEWDKGHLAPAATFSDNYQNLAQTFSFLNCTLQHQSLNRGEWRKLESKEREWDDHQDLIVGVENVFEDMHIILETGAHVPSRMIKHIYFSRDKRWRCFDFPNEKPNRSWQLYEVKHNHSKNVVYKK